MNSLLRPLLAGAAALLSGCVSAKYQRADSATPPPTALNLTVTPASSPSVLTATINTVIAFQGPGSWKREAYWDEYALTLANPGAEPVVVESAALADFLGDTSAPGADPWLLEKQSQTRQEELERRAKNVLVQIGAGYLALAVPGTLATLSTTAAGVTAGAVAGVVLLPTYIIGSVIRNRSSRRDIEAEFARRRLALPLTLAPGETRQGSLFFRISPGPQRLVLVTRTGAQAAGTTIDLTPLAGLHLKASPAEAAPTAPAAKPAASAP